VIEFIQLQDPWWHYVLRALIVYVFVLIVLRGGGKRTVGEFTPFDLVVIMLLSEAMQSALVPENTSIIAPAISAVTLVALNFIVGFASARSRPMDRLVTGDPVVLVRNGRVLDKAMRSENVPPADLDEAIRRAGLRKVASVRLAVLETDGEITIVPQRTPAAAAKSSGK
jgi:uncharacterized membrane protein YcaP (DUF421 family)